MVSLHFVETEQRCRIKANTAQGQVFSVSGYVTYGYVCAAY